jgi:putative signal transducing protein
MPPLKGLSVVSLYAALKRRSSTSLLAVLDAAHETAGLDGKQLPQGLKPTSLWDIGGTTEVVPFPIFVESLEELESRECGISGRLCGGFREWEMFMAESDATAEERRPDPNEKLVKVFDSEEESEALVVKGLLDSAGIENDLTSASGSFLQDAFPGLGGVIILVREEDAEKARNLIAESQRAAGDAQDDDETKS